MRQATKNFRSYLKNVFWPILQRRTSVFVGASFQILEILKYACGLKIVPAALVPAQPLSEDGTLNQNPIFEMASREDSRP